MSFCEESTPTARKQYRCTLCDRPIAKGEKHVKTAGVYCGDFYSLRSHTACNKHTAGWDAEEWEYIDPYEFRKQYLEGDQK